METAWLIESEQSHYIGAVTIHSSAHSYQAFEWVTNHRDAIRFARCEDAEAVIQIIFRKDIAWTSLGEVMKGPTEHMWMDDEEQAVPKTKEEWDELERTLAESGQYQRLEAVAAARKQSLQDAGPKYGSPEWLEAYKDMGGA